MVPLSALNVAGDPPLGSQYLWSFIPINSTDFPAVSVVTWDYSRLDGGLPAVSSVQIIPRYAQLVYVVNQ